MNFDRPMRQQSKSCFNFFQTSHIVGRDIMDHRSIIFFEKKSTTRAGHVKRCFGEHFACKKHAFFQMRFSRIVVGFGCSLKNVLQLINRATFHQQNAKKFAFDLTYFLTIKGYAKFFNPIIGDVQLSAPDYEQRNIYPDMSRDCKKNLSKKIWGSFWVF